MPLSSTSGRSDPRADYTRHLESRRASLSEAVRQHVMFGYLRVAALAAGLAAAYAAFARGVFSAWWLVGPAVAFFWAGARLERAVNAHARLGRAVAFYERALERLDGRWAGTGGETGDRFLDEQHLYARDLDLFGDASLFELLSCARTRIGEETLAAWLKTPAELPAVRERQEAVAEFAPRTDLREDLAVLGEDARTGVHAEALAAWGEQPARLDSSAVPAWAWPLSGAGALAALALLVWLAARVDLLQLDANTLAALRSYGLALYAICGAVVWRFNSRTTAILRDADEAAHDLGLLAGVLRRLEAERFTAARLAALRAALDVEDQSPSRRIARLHALMDLVDSRENLVVRLVGPLLLWDLHLVHALERWRRTSGPAVRRWLVAVGEMEALSSLAGYHYEHPDDVFPDLSDGTPCFDSEGLGHPLLSEAVSVRNDVQLAGELRVLMVSGSNMSGKSTLLRTVGVNTVLALAGAPVRARRLRLTPLEIGASIRIQDSLQGGVSRFYAEITRLGLIMRRAGEAPPVLFLVDELLHGTNSHDRRIGAEAIVRGLVERGAIGLVTTHDLALAHVADALGARGANVHFEDVLEGGRMHFDYRMHRGVVQTSNALALMRSVGLDV
jgi:MutS domain V